MTADSKLNFSQNGTQRETMIKPRILMPVSPASGHTAPMIKVAELLVQRGYEVTFIGGEQFKNAIENTGSKYVEVESFDNDKIFGQERKNVPAGPQKLMYDINMFFIEPTKARKELLYKVLEEMKSEEPEREIILMPEPFYLGDHALYHDGPLPRGFTKRPRSVTIHALANLFTSIQLPPVGSLLEFETSKEAKQRFEEMHKQIFELFEPSMKLHEETFRSLGGQDYKKMLPLDFFHICGDVSLHMYPPSVEYPRPDPYSTVRIIGALPRVAPSPGAVMPSFWDEVTRGDKSIVTVTQGTVAIDYEELVIPTFNALSGRDDILVVAILGVKGATLPDGFEVPRNGRVIDYLSYDTILPYTSALVCNAGYGGFIHGVINAVPMVLAGITEDKPDIAMRGEWAGIAINLKSGNPEPGKIREAVNTLLTNPKYKKRISEIQKENENMNTADAIEKHILEQAALAAEQ